MNSLRIGVSADYDLAGSAFFRSDLLTCLAHHGVSIVAVFESMIDDLARHELMGLILPGSPLDVCPSLYGEKKRYPEVKINQRRQELEWRLVEKAVALNLPILGICWGMQILNVFFGGSLYQHLPADLSGVIEHEQKTPSDQPSHEVFFERDGYLFRELKMAKMPVNSTHHQGVKELANPLIVEAKSNDGLIEAFRHKHLKFVLGVEWHPERLKDDPIIPCFLKVCQR
jgi:putative glutamine amidotransferase